MTVQLCFSQRFRVRPKTLVDYGAFDISMVTDLPLFIDPFLLFNSTKPAYQQLHEGILKYLRFLRDKSASGDLDPALVGTWFQFKEVRQNWLGFSVMGNHGHALGAQFAKELHRDLNAIFRDFGAEQITRARHLEKLTLITGKVGRDGISDFTTSLIKEYLLDYTQAFTLQHIATSLRRKISVPKVRFNYKTESWEPGAYTLPALADDFVLLTPADMLTRDDTWISGSDLVRRFAEIPPALPDAQLRAAVNNYFALQLPREPKSEDISRAVYETVRCFPELIDFYIKLKEDTGEQAKSLSEERVRDTSVVFVGQVQALYADMLKRTDFYQSGWSSYDEALSRALAFKHYVEDQDGYKLVNRAGMPFANETEVQIFFRPIWFASAYDLNREPNNGRGPADFAVSLGAADKSLIEFKLGSNRQLKQNLQNQVKIYEKANQTSRSVKVILYYTAPDEARVHRILDELKLTGDKSIVLIDARSDNKPSASKAKTIQPGSE